MLIVISSPIPVNDEHTTVNRLFDEGLDIFHLRKKKISEDEMREFLEEISSVYFDKIVLHSHYNLIEEYGLKGAHISPLESGLRDKYKHISTSFHSLKEIEDTKEEFNYAFLSPIFDSISKENYKSSFDLVEAKRFLKERKIIALRKYQWKSDLETLTNKNTIKSFQTGNGKESLV